MPNIITRALDAARLTREVERLEEENAALRAARKPSAPSFREVATSFDASCLSDAVMERVVSELAPILEQDVLRTLKLMRADLSRAGRQAHGRVAADAFDNRIMHFRFDASAASTNFAVCV